jgi:hypothetical protein
LSGQPFDESAASISRTQALRPSVPLYRHMLYGSGLTHALDFLVLMHVHFMCEDGKEPTVQDIVDALRREGIRNANGKGGGLVGSKAVYESITRLRAAGFLHRVQSNGGNFGKVSYKFHEFPAKDPDWTPPEMSDSPEDAPVSLTGEAVPAGNDITAGQTASPHKASADKASADRRSGKRDVSAGQTASPHRQSGMAPPPHPPEEEDPPPPTPSSPSGPLPSQREEEAEFSSEEITAAEVFLQQMSRWQAGAATARKCAPRLLRAMREQGWPRMAEMDDALGALLEADIFKNTGGAVSWTKCLPGWIDDLRLYCLVKPRPKREAAGREMCRKPGHGGGAFPVDDCSECVREARPGREGPSRIDVASLKAALHSRAKGR